MLYLIDTHATDTHNHARTHTYTHIHTTDTHISIDVYKLTNRNASLAVLGQQNKKK
jgi:hypothetical protein